MALVAALLTGCAPKSTVDSAAQGASVPPPGLVRTRVSDIEAQITTLKNSTTIPESDKNREIAALQSEEAAMTRANP
jgi:hypothetical protein